MPLVPEGAPSRRQPPELICTVAVPLAVPFTVQVVVSGTWLVQLFWMTNVSPLVKLAGCEPVPPVPVHQLAVAVGSTAVPLVGE